MVKKKTIMRIAFAGLAALSLISGYIAQNRTSTPISKTVYSYSPVNKGTISGSVGVPGTGLDYIVSNPSAPIAAVISNVSKDSFAVAGYEHVKNESSFFGQAAVGKQGSISAQASFSPVDESSKLEYSRKIGSGNVNVSYNQAIGSKDYLGARIGFNLFGRAMSANLKYTL